MKKVLSISALLMLIFALAACGEDPATGEAKGYISGSDVAKVYSDPKAYVGYDIEFIGKAFVVETSEDSLYVQAFQDIKNSDNNTLVVCSLNSGIKVDDYIKVKGRIVAEINAENAFGGNLTLPQVNASSVEKISYIEACSPTLKSVDVNMTKTQYKKYSITISKVEFAENETRVYIKAENNSSVNFNVYDFNAKIKQGKKQYSTQDNYDADYQKLESEVIPGVEAEGIIAFPPIEQKDFTFTIDAYSDDYNIDFKLFSFTIKVD